LWVFPEREVGSKDPVEGKVTLDTYSHVMPGLHAQAAAEMQKLFAEKENEL
jgi:hypothetical protein